MAEDPVKKKAIVELTCVDGIDLVTGEGASMPRDELLVVVLEGPDRDLGKALGAHLPLIGLETLANHQETP